MAPEVTERGAAPTAPPPARGSAARRLLAGREAGVLGALLATVLAASFLVEGFASGRNAGFLVLDVAAIAIIALPMTLVVITGEIDLSVASTLGLTSAVMGHLWVAGLRWRPSSRCAWCWARCSAPSTACWSRSRGCRPWR